MIAGEIERHLRQLIREECKAAIAELMAGAHAGPGAHISVKAFANARSLGVSTVRAMIRDGRLTAIKIGRSVRIPADAVIGKSTTAAVDTDEVALRRLGVVRGGRP